MQPGRVLSQSTDGNFANDYPVFQGIVFAGSKQSINISDESLKRVQRLFDTDSQSQVYKTPQLSAQFSNYASENPLNFHSSNFDGGFIKPDHDQSLYSSQNLQSGIHTNHCFAGFSIGLTTGSGKSLSLSEEAMNRAKALFSDDELSQTYQNQQRYQANFDMKPQIGFSFGSGKQLEISVEAMKRARSLFEDESQTDFIKPDIFHDKNSSQKTLLYTDKKDQ